MALQAPDSERTEWSKVETDVNAVLEVLQMTAVKVVADVREVISGEQSADCRVSFKEALTQAIRAFARTPETDSGTGNDSPAAVVAALGESIYLPSDPTPEAIEKVLLGYLRHDPQAAIVLLTPTTLTVDKYRFPPEYGESTEDNWVFRILLPKTFAMLIWVIVDRTGTKPAYAYTFD